MDCNREEASRAKNIAEKKMESKDFTGARKIALKAQKLFPDLENIAQILVVCDVHCAAEKKLPCNEKDWYGILQIDQTADEATIKKQYRKFALQLHPDKNKFAGAEAAFKLIGEAQTVLLDREKRATHDRNRASYRTPQNVYVNVNVGMQNHVRPNFMPSFTYMNPQQQQSRQPAQPGLNDGCPTFWTVCPFCSVKYQYYREVLNRSLRCQSCNRPFIAYDQSAQGTSQPTYSSQQSFGQPKDGLNYCAKVDVGSQGNSYAGNVNTKPFHRKSHTSSKRLGKRQRKHVVEISESSDSFSSTDSESDMISDKDGVTGGQNSSAYKGEQPRRSTRQKQQVSYRENVSDDDDDIVTLSKTAEACGSPSVVEEDHGKAAKVNVQDGLAADLKDNKKEVKKKHILSTEEILLNRKVENKELRGKALGGSKMMAEVSEYCTPDSASNATEHPEPEILVCPDAEFNDFDKDKNEDCFAVGQIWAIYDSKDGMPRFYALIRRVFSSGFKLRITWLEPKPTDNDEINWVNEQLPVACGMFGLSGTEITEDHPMFSHRILFEKTGVNTFKVYPRKGETWAIYKNWDIKWYTDAKSHQKYEYEFVEILSDYVEGEGVFVAYLAKLKGFVSLFFRVMKKGSHSFQIPSAELFRFSHRVPSFKMTGQERVGVPIGSYELDPASLPSNPEDIAVPENLDVKVGSIPSGGVSTRSSDRLKPVTASDGDVSTFQANLQRSNSVKNNGSVNKVEDCSAPSTSTSEAMEIPDPQFYNFDACKSLEKFRIGQVWAFYSDEDGLPRYYGQIMKIGTGPELELHIMWLVSVWLPQNSIRWEDNNMPISCGRFQLKNGTSNVYTNTLSLSHRMGLYLDVKRKEFSIFPRKGEFWAIFQKWTEKIKCSDLVNCKYDIVQVFEESAFWIDVTVMDIVGGYNSVFKRSSVTMRIPQSQLLRFSHQIPSFKLTEEHGNLQGCWELDPGALPTHFFTPQ